MPFPDVTLHRESMGLLSLSRIGCDTYSGSISLGKWKATISSLPAASPSTRGLGFPGIYNEVITGLMSINANYRIWDLGREPGNVSVGPVAAFASVLSGVLDLEGS